MITIHQRHRQTDRRTDIQTTCNRNTALCTKVHRAVKMYSVEQCRTLWGKSIMRWRWRMGWTEVDLWLLRRTAMMAASVEPGSEVCLPDSATATQLCRRFHQYAHCLCRCPDACRLFQTSTSPVACWCCSSSNLCPVQKLCYKLQSVVKLVTFTFIGTSKFCLFYDANWQAVYDA